jgi:hypothetical protein
MCDVSRIATRVEGETTLGCILVALTTQRALGHAVTIEIQELGLGRLVIDPLEGRCDLF